MPPHAASPEAFTGIVHLLVVTTLLAGCINTALIVLKGRRRSWKAWICAWLPILNHFACPVFMGMPDVALKDDVARLQAKADRILELLEGEEDARPSGKAAIPGRDKAKKGP
jgi:hypothetical protein